MGIELLFYSVVMFFCSVFVQEELFNCGVSR